MMDSKKKTTVDDVKAGMRAAARERLRMLMRKQDDSGQLIPEEEDGVLVRRGVEQEDPFQQFYTKEALAMPPYNFARLMVLYEESDILQECVDAMKQNVDGFGYGLQYIGDDKKQKDVESQSQLARATNFFDYANESQSWQAIRKMMRMDLEILGNGAFEIVRNIVGEMVLVYYLPFTNVRAAANPGTPVKLQVSIPRNGRVEKVAVRKYFRRYCQVSVVNPKRLRWFKEIGDPRILDGETGEYKKTRQECKIVATELLHFKTSVGGSIYGIPRWIGSVLDVMGRRSSQYVNYDLFESQGIPPMAVLVSGGRLTDESLAELEAVIRSLRGLERWNRVMLLESELDSSGLEEKGQGKIDLKNLSEYRKEDQMFGQYLLYTEKGVRHRFRLPPTYVGEAESFTHATAKSAKETAEEQVFVPEREEFDEIVNRRILPELKVDLWKYQTKGPRIVGSEEISSGVKAFAEAGAFTINHAIEMANAAFGLSMSKFSDTWADYPMPIVMKLLDKAMLKGMEAVAEPIEPPPPPPQPQIGELQQRPAITKIDGFDLFSEAEKQLYKRLWSIQQVVEGARLNEHDSGTAL